MKISIKKRLKDIRLVATDCDGVLTDGGLYYTESGEEMKRFNSVLLRRVLATLLCLATVLSLAVIPISAAKNTDGSYKGKLIGNQTSTTLGPVFYVYSGGTFNLFGGELTVSSTSTAEQTMATA